MSRVKPRPGTKGPFIPGRGFTQDKRGAPYICLLTSAFLQPGQTTQQQDFVTFLKESNLAASQIAGGEDIPKADVVVKWTYELGKSLVPPK